MFSNDKQITEIKFSGKYVNGQSLDLLRDFRKNTYIIKGSTGIGGTTSLLNYTEGHCLIISPNTGMIMIKADPNNKYDSDVQLFIHSKSKNDWDDVKNSLTTSSNVIINCTPDQLLIIRKKDRELYNQLINIPIFLDEIHTYIIDANFRDVMGEALELVYNEWRANFKLSTATPLYNFLDLPKNKSIDIYKVSRVDETPKPLQISNDIKDAKKFIQSEIDKKRLVIVFTNNINFHKSFSDYKIKNLVGQNLEKKLKPFGRGCSPDIVIDAENDNSDIIFLSSSYYAGFDINRKCSICIISEQSNEAYKISPNNIIQCYGRGRHKDGYFNTLLINATATTDINGQPTYYPKDIIEVNKLVANMTADLEYWDRKNKNRTYDNEFINNKEVTSANYVNRAYLTTSTLNSISDYQQYNESVLKRFLEGHNFEITDYKCKKDVEINPPIHANFQDRINELMTCKTLDLYYSYLTIIRNLKYKDEGVFSKKLAFEYLTAYLLKKTNGKKIIDLLSSPRVYPNELYNTMDLFLRANIDTKYYQDQRPLSKDVDKFEFKWMDGDGINSTDEIKWLIDNWMHLYECHKSTNNNHKAIIEREMTLYDLFYNVELCIKYNVDKSHRTRNVVKDILTSCIDRGITLDEGEYIWLKDVIESIYKAIDEGETYPKANTRKHSKNKIINANLFLLTNGKIYESKENKNREYNPITQLPAKMRVAIPIKYLSIDLSSANPQIIDSILGTNIGLEVYHNLMAKRGITRHRAKKLFNSTLNNHKLSVHRAKKVYLDAGYTSDKATELARQTAGVVKGSFFEIMTYHEKQLMLNYADVLPIKTYRFHDAIIMKLEDVETNNIVLPTMVKGYKYHIESFNDGTPYDGLVTDNDPTDKMLNNYRYTKG